MRRVWMVFAAVMICWGVQAQEGFDAKMRRAGLVDVLAVDSTLRVKLMYSAPDNFMRRDVYGDLETAYLLPHFARKVAAAQRLLRERRPGWRLLVCDAARPVSVQRQMYELVKGTPNQVYVADGTRGGRHNYGVAVDVTLLDETGAPYYLYCTVEAKPGYVFRSGTGTLKYANEEWKPGKWAEAIWNDDWMDMDNISAGACYKLHDESDTNLGGLWLNRLELTNLNLSVKAPVAGESPAPGSDYCKIDGLPPYMKLERVDWLKCYDDWRYYSDKPFTFQAGKTSDGENCEYQCFIYVSYDLSGVGVAKGAKFYLNDTPCKLDWENKFFWTETMTAEGNPVQEDPVITAKAGANGTITPSGSVTVKAGADQAFAIQPNSGYTVSKVLVDGTDVGAVTSYTFKNVTANHTIEAVFAKVEAKPTNPFVDVAEGTYYYDPVLWAVANGITSGVDATHFEPEGTCTRAHAVTFLWRASGQPEPKTTNMPFRDVKPGSYYEKAVLWAVENKITNGTGTTTFSPDENCTRAQIVTFLWRSEGEPYASDSNNPFTDIASDYYMDAVFWAVKEGITNGTTPTTFSPNERCTRAQIVTFIYRAMAS